MDPKQWGPDTWTYLHVLTFKSSATYNVLKDFFYHLQFLLPCSTCRNNYKKHLSELPFPSLKKDISRWLIELHNKVNQTRYTETAMNDYWQKRIQTMKSSKDIGLWTFLQCAVHTHPGKRRISNETLAAHRFLWDHIKDLMPTFVSDRVILLHYLEQHPIQEIASKTIYHRNLHTFFHHFDLIDSYIKEHQLCMR